jgi:hypothetical protein
MEHCKKIAMTLKDYLAQVKLDQKSFAAKIGATQQAVSLWVSGHATPRPFVMARITKVTNGLVTANDFAVSEAAE